MINKSEKTKKTAYAVFIVESLRQGDFQDGKILHQILELSGLISVYRKVETVAEFKAALKEFIGCRFRYLHLSCHADKTGLEIAGEEITNNSLQDLLLYGIKNKRIFMSACQGGNKELAGRLVVNGAAYSLIGTPVDLYFSKSVLFWPSFYHIIYENDTKSMKRGHLIDSLQKCVDMFSVPINYYSRIGRSSTHLRRVKIRAKQKPESRKILL